MSRPETSTIGGKARVSKPTCLRLSTDSPKKLAGPGAQTRIRVANQDPRTDQTSIGLLLRAAMERPSLRFRKLKAFANRAVTKP